MPKSPTELPSGVRITDTLAVTQFSLIFPIHEIRKILEKHDRSTVRVRHLPNEFVVYFVMMLALFRDCSHREVYRCVVDAFYRLAGKSLDDIVIPSAAALSKARDRVEDLPFRDLFHKFAVPTGEIENEAIFYRNWRKIAIDGCLVDVEDTKANRQYFDAPKNQHKTKSRNPKARFVNLMEIGTHQFFAGEIGRYSDSENKLAESLVSYLTKDMICIADRNFYSYEFFKKVSETGAALLCRIQSGMTFQPERQFDDGSFETTIYASDDKKRENGIKARFFQYKVKGSKEKFFLLTNVLNPKLAPAIELAALYQERWEHENTLDELKTHLNIKSLVLRSKKPRLVIQELWGILMTHHVVRRTMTEAAKLADLDPDRLSFIHSVRVIKRTLVKPPRDFPPSPTTTESTQ